MHIVKWVAVLVLLAVIGLAGAAALAATFTSGMTRASMASGLEPLLAVGGSVVALLCGVGVYALARSLEVMWPVYLVPVAFVAIHLLFRLLR
jgi:hypothetical protein